MAELVGNVLVGQSGGPTAVINASVAGIISEALNHECIEEIYGALNGVLGILQEDLIDLASESQQQIRALRHTPGAGGADSASRSEAVCCERLQEQRSECWCFVRRRSCSYPSVLRAESHCCRCAPSAGACAPRNC